MVCKNYKVILKKKVGVTEDNDPIYKFYIIADLVCMGNEARTNLGSSGEYVLDFNSIDGFPIVGDKMSLFPGSKFYECDTKKSYILDADYSIVEYSEGGSGSHEEDVGSIASDDSATYGQLDFSSYDPGFYRGERTSGTSNVKYIYVTRSTSGVTIVREIDTGNMWSTGLNNSFVVTGSGSVNLKGNTYHMYKVASL